MRPLIVSLLLLLFHTLPGHAWGNVGHKTVAAIADHYLTSEGQAYVQKILLDNEDLVSVATWADLYRTTTPGKFSAPYHFIDAEDHPPSNCNVAYKRDCNSNSCIVSAITNYTERIQDPSLPAKDVNEALKFLIHFFGDITQPLHNEAEALGGNLIIVTWDGELRRLHRCWDEEMVERDAGGNSTAVIASFSAMLTENIDVGTFPDTTGWISCMDTKNMEECALEWATDANHWNCDYVLKTDMSGRELNGTYYEGARPIIELQLAKGGYRLGKFLNKLAAAQPTYAQELKV